MHCFHRGSCSLVNAHSDVSETNDRQKERYEASWLDLVLETRPWLETTVFEKDSSREESYERNQVAHVLVQRSPAQRNQVARVLVQRSPAQSLRLGREGGNLTKHQLPLRTPHLVPILTPSKAHQLPLRTPHLVPILTPSKAAPTRDSSRSLSPTDLRQQLKYITDLESTGVCLDKQEISRITKDLPGVNPPIRVNFRASRLVSPPREFSLSFQR